MLHLSHIEYKFITFSKQTLMDQENYISQNATENGILKLGYEKKTNAYFRWNRQCVCTVKSKHVVRT